MQMKKMMRDMCIKIENERLIECIHKLDVKTFPAYEILRSSFIENEIEEVYIVGVGDPCRNLASRYQISLIVGLCTDLGIKSLFAYDPVTCEDCQRRMTEMNITTLEFDDICQYEFKKGRAFYMIHCPAFLYHNLLVTNYKVDKLKDLYIVGNSLINYYDLHKYTQDKLSKYVIKEVVEKEIIKEVILPFKKNLFFTGTNIIIANHQELQCYTDDDLTQMGILHSEI